MTRDARYGWYTDEELQCRAAMHRSLAGAYEAAAGMRWADGHGDEARRKWRLADDHSDEAVAMERELERRASAAPPTPLADVLFR